jgi:ribosome-binding ATPase YchF (GTP1/OBG family)
MSKLTVREQEALTQTIIDRIQDIEMVNAEADFKPIKKQFDDITNQYKHLHNQKEDIKNKLKILDEEHKKLRNEFNKDRTFAKLSQISNSHYWSGEVLEQWSVHKEDCYTTRANISRDVIIATLKTKEDVEKLISELVVAYQPRKKLKIAS